MDYLTFITSLVDSLAWPAATIVVATLFRQELVGLISRVRKGKIGNVEFEFEEDVRSLEAQAEEIGSVHRDKVGIPTISLVTSNPRAAIIDAWLEIEDQVIDVALKHDLVRPTAKRYPTGALRGIEQSDILNPTYRALLKELRELRNKAAHEQNFHPSADSVLSYIQLAKDLKNELGRLAR